MRLFISCLLLLPVLALATPVKDTLQVIEVGEGTTAIKLSKSDPNRLSVQGEAITSIACMQGFCVNTIRHKESDALLVLDNQAQGSTGFSFYVTTESGKTIPLLGVPEDIAGQTIEIKAQGGSLKAKKFEHKSPYTTTLMTLIKTMMRFQETGIAPEGYGVTTYPNQDNPKETSGLVLNTSHAFHGDAFNGLIYQAHNHSNAPLKLSGEQFYHPGVLAVAVKDEQLNAGASTQIFLVTKNGAGR